MKKKPADLLPDRLVPAVWVPPERRYEFPAVLVITHAEDRPWRDLKAWQFWIRLYMDGYQVDLIWAIDGCERHEKTKAENYIRKRAQLFGATKLDIFEFCRPPTSEQVREIEAANRRLRSESRVQS